MKTTLISCNCGCGDSVTKPENQYLHGHNAKGRKLSEETKQKISKTQKGITKEINPNLTHSKETKRIMSLKMIGNQNPLGNKHSKETKRKMSLAAVGHSVSVETRKKISKARKGITKEINPNLIRSKSYKKKKRIAQQEKWDDPIYRENQLKSIFASRRIKPNKAERKLRNGLNRLFPKEYKYVGNGSVVIGYKNPDFININGQKKIIELNGDYWHSKKITGRTKVQEENQRINHFTKYGYKTLIVWESELRNIPKLKRKLKAFHNE